jgi:hypothetical protein
MKLYLDKRESAAVSFAFEEAPTPQEIANQIAAKMLS